MRSVSTVFDANGNFALPLCGGGRGVGGWCVGDRERQIHVSRGQLRATEVCSSMGSWQPFMIFAADSHRLVDALTADPLVHILWAPRTFNSTS